jgi:hypothetical protein
LESNNKPNSNNVQPVEITERKANTVAYQSPKFPHARSINRTDEGWCFLESYHFSYRLDSGANQSAYTHS